MYELFWIFSLVLLLLVVLTYKRLETYVDETFSIRKSPVAGQGVFTLVNRPANAYLFPVIFKRNRRLTLLGSKVNHSFKPNCTLTDDATGWHLMASRDLNEGEECLVDYREGPSFVKLPNPKWT